MSLPFIVISVTIVYILLYITIGYWLIGRDQDKVGEEFERLDREQDQRRFFKKYLKPQGLIFDIGACNGEKTDIFLEIASQVIAIEPQFKYAELLRRKYEGDSRVIVKRTGISEHAGVATLSISEKYPGFSSFNPSWQYGTKYFSFVRSEVVPMMTLDALITLYGIPDFCKFDVEGYELQVLNGLSEKIPLLSFEFHSNDVVHINGCLTRLTSLGFSQFNFVLYENTEMYLPTWVDAEIIKKRIMEVENDVGTMIWGDIYAQ